VACVLAFSKIYKNTPLLLEFFNINIKILYVYIIYLCVCAAVCVVFGSLCSALCALLALALLYWVVC
jgi:hypothetical protein